mgnify:CR=1 FL=1
MKQFPSARFELLLSEKGTRLIPTRQLRKELQMGRVPLYVLDLHKTTKNEKIYLEKIGKPYTTFWITQKIFSFPVEHRLTQKENKTVFELGRPVPKQVEEVESEVGDCLRALINVCSATPVQPLELMTMAECLWFLRLIGDLGKYPYSKLCLFDEGTLHIEPMNPVIHKGLDLYLENKKTRLQPKMIQATTDICHRFLQSLPNQRMRGA